MVDSVLVGYELYESGRIVGWLLGELHAAPTERDKMVIDGLLPQADLVIVETKAESSQQELEYMTMNNKNPFYTKRKADIDAIVERFRPFYRTMFKDKAEMMIAWHPIVLNDFIMGRIAHMGKGEDYLQRANEYENPTMYCACRASERKIRVVGACPSEKQYGPFWELQTLEDSYNGLQELFSGKIDVEKIRQGITEKRKEPSVSKEVKEAFHNEERDLLFTESIYTTIRAEKKPLAIYGAGHSKEVLENLENKGVQNKKIM